MRSAVAGTSERLRRRVYEVTGLDEVFNDNNRNVILKSSPEKTVAALSLLAEKEGTVVKLNDTGRWRKRHALLVPHTFLYYFGDDSAATDLTPRGVIDLEQYTDIKIVEENVVRLAPLDENSPIRTFYIRLANNEEAEAWAQAIQNTRFDFVREERDALRSAKLVMTEQLSTLTELLKASRGALEASQRREAAAVSEVERTNAKEARRLEQLQALLASACSSGATGAIGATRGNDGVGVFSIEEARTRTVGGRPRRRGAACELSELAALEETIVERAREVTSLKIANETLRAEAAIADKQRRKDAAAALKLVDQEGQRANVEVAARETLEAEMRALRRELEENKAEKEEARTNLGIVAAACRETEAKSRELQEHRRVLAREVKSSRVEQRRLSAALACATTAATTAAATVAATTGSCLNGNRDRSSSAASWAAGDGTTCVLDRREGREAWADVLGQSTPFTGEKRGLFPGETPRVEDTLSKIDQQKSSKLKQPTTPDARLVHGVCMQHKDVVDSSSGEAEAPGGVCDGVGSAAAASTWLRPSPLGISGTSGDAEERTGGESGSTSPEAGSPRFCETSDNGDSVSTSKFHYSSSLSRELTGSGAFSLPAALTKEMSPRRGKLCGVDSGASDCQRPSETAEYSKSDGILTGSLHLLGSNASPVSPSAVVATITSSIVVEESSRFNQMVQSFSAGLRESRRARRTPLLGSLDDDSDAGGNLEEEEGGVTDGTDGDSRHDTTTTTCREGGDRSSWSAWSAVGGGSCHELQVKEGERGARSDVDIEDYSSNEGRIKLAALSGTVVGEVSGNDKALPVSDCGDGDEEKSCHDIPSKIRRSSFMQPVVPLEDPIDRSRDFSASSIISNSSSSKATPQASTVATKVEEPAEIDSTVLEASSPCNPSSAEATQTVNAAAIVASPADWLRKVGRPDGDAVPAINTSLSTTFLKSGGEGAASVGEGAAGVGEGAAGVGGGVALAAAAAAAAERGGRVSLEAAAAARRWEAKLKGSLISMTGGVRWGMLSDADKAFKPV